MTQGSERAVTPWREVPEKDWYNWRWQLAHRLRDPVLLPGKILAHGIEREEIVKVTNNYPL